MIRAERIYIYHHKIWISIDLHDRWTTEGGKIMTPYSLEPNIFLRSYVTISVLSHFVDGLNHGYRAWEVLGNLKVIFCLGRKTPKGVSKPKRNEDD